MDIKKKYSYFNIIIVDVHERMREEKATIFSEATLAASPEFQLPPLSSTILYNFTNTKQEMLRVYVGGKSCEQFRYLSTLGTMGTNNRKAESRSMFQKMSTVISKSSLKWNHFLKKSIRPSCSCLVGKGR